MGEGMISTRFTILGPMQITGPNGMLTRFRTRKSQALFLLLLQGHDRPKTREYLVDILWPNSADTSGRASLRQELAVLRKALRDIGAPEPLTEQDGIVLRLNNSTLDLDDFDIPTETKDLLELTRRSNLYQGPFCDGFAAPTHALDDLLQANRSRLLDKAIALRLAILEHPDTKKTASGVVNAAAAVLQLDPAQEIAHRALIEQYLASGQAAKAKHQYQLCKNVLRTEYDASPDAKTVAVADRIEGHLEAPLTRRNTSRVQYKSLTVLGVSLPLEGADLDAQNPEDLLEKIESFHRWVAEVCAPYRGVVFQKDNGQCLVAFGCAQADEHDTDRAVFAALKLAGPNSLKPDLSLSCALDYGTAVLQQPEHADITINGAPILNAQSLMRHVAPSEIWASTAVLAVAPATLVSDRTDDLNNTSKHRASRVIGFSKVSNRFEANRLSLRLTEFVGRERQLARLNNCWENLHNSRFIKVHVYGESGIGKSRFLHQFTETIGDYPAIRLEASPHHSQIALYPFQQLIYQETVTDNDPNMQSTNDLLTSWCQTIGVSPDKYVPALQMLFGNEDSGKSINNQSNIEQLKSALISCIRAKLSRNKSCVIVEDLQWCDPTTRTFIGELSEHLKDLPVMFVSTARSTKNIDTDTIAIEMPRLNTYESWDFINTAYSGPLPQSLTDEIIRRSDGIPLCLEELCKTADVAAPTRRTNTPPMSLRGSLFAQIDQLGPESTVLQCASVLGQSFNYAQVASVCEQERNDLCVALNELETRDIIYSSGRPPHAHYEFKVSLIREMVYETLPKQLLSCLHESAARFFEGKYRAGDTTMASVAAEHWSKLGNASKVISMSLAAARHLILLSAHSEAIHHLTNAQEALVDIPKPSRDLLEFDILSLLGPQMLASKGFADTAVETIHDRLRKLTISGRAKFSGQSLWGLWSFYIVRSRLKRAGELADLFRETAVKDHRDDLVAVADYMEGINLFYCGNFSQASTLLEPLCLNQTKQPNDTLLLSLGLDIRAAAASYCGWIYALDRNPDRARNFSSIAINLSQDAGHDFSLAYSHVFAAVMELFLDNPRLAQPHSSIANSLATEHGFAQIKAHSQICDGRITEKSHDKKGLTLLKKGLEAYQATGASLAVPYARTWIAEAYLSRGYEEQANEQFDKISKHMTETGEVYFKEYTQHQNSFAE